MKLSCVLTAVNNNSLYLDFVPYFIKAWVKLYSNTDVKVILVSNTIPEILKGYEQNLILFEPIKNLNTVYIAQNIRTLYPALLDYDGGILISDVDMIPMNSHFFTQVIKDIDDNKFISYNNVLMHLKIIPICYNVATNKVWGDIMGIKTEQDVIQSLKNNYPKNYKPAIKSAWFKDQTILYNKVVSWNKKTNNLFNVVDRDIIVNGKKIKYDRLFRATSKIKKTDVCLQNAKKDYMQIIIV